MTDVMVRSWRARWLVVAVVIAAVVLAFAGTATTTTSALNAVGSRGDHATVAGPPVHDLLVTVARRAGAQVPFAPGAGLGGGAAAAGLWALLLTGTTTRVFADGRTRWRARLVGAPPILS